MGSVRSLHLVEGHTRMGRCAGGHIIGGPVRAQSEGYRPRKRGSFTQEFKQQAVRLVLDEGRKIAQVARELELTRTSLRRWVEQAQADRGGGAAGLTSEEREELARLRKENRELRMDKEILKKAAAFFAKNQV